MKYYICTFLFFISFLNINTAQVSNGETTDYLPDSTIRTCEEFLFAQTQMYNEMETIVNTMRDVGSRTSHEGKEAYERAVNLKTKSKVLLKTKKSLIDNGILDVYCANNIY